MAGWTASTWICRGTRTVTAHPRGRRQGARARPICWPGYFHAVHKASLEYIAGITPEELARVVDDNWDPPVTASARLVSIVDDCAQHLGQAAYVRGIAR